MKIKKKIYPILLLLLFLAGCHSAPQGEEPAAAVLLLPDGQEVELTVTTLRPLSDVAEQTDAWTAALAQLPELRELDLSESVLTPENYKKLDACCSADVLYSPAVNGEALDLSAAQLDLSALTAEQAAAYLPWLPLMGELQELQLGDTALSPEEYKQFTESCSARVLCSPVVNGAPLDLSAAQLDLSALTGEQTAAYLPWLPVMSELRELQLGEEDEQRALSWEDILALEQAAPQAVPRYSFSLFDKSFTLADTELDLNHRKMTDGGELVRRVVRCMPKLELLDMDFCGVADEDMASIRDEFPQVKVVWRVFFGMQYNCRTDVEKILASWPAAGLISDHNCSALQYCTEVRFLDIGHNVPLTDISFVASMPKLEVCILAYLQDLTDISPLASCPKLEYLELMQCSVQDVSPLGDLQELRHVNLVLNPVDDITCLYDLTDMERLYLGFYTKVPQEQLDEILRRNPDLELDLTSCTPRGGKWRGEYVGDECIYVDRYVLLKEQFGYHYPFDYALKEGDPLSDYHG